MTTLETTLDVDAILREINKDIKTAAAPGASGYVDVTYDMPELPAGRNHLPMLCLNTPEEILQAKLKIAKTVAFIREHGPEAYYAATSSTPS